MIEMDDPGSRDVVEVVEPNDETKLRIYVDRGDSTRGTTELFYAAYCDEDLETRYGWFCNHCESLATTMDVMGRIWCSNCDNERPPTEWDAGYL